MNLDQVTNPFIATAEESPSQTHFNVLNEIEEVFQIFRWDLEDSEVNQFIATLDSYRKISFRPLLPLLAEVFTSLVASENQKLIRDFFKDTFCSTSHLLESENQLRKWKILLSTN